MRATSILRSFFFFPFFRLHVALLCSVPLFFRSFSLQSSWLLSRRFLHFSPIGLFTFVPDVPLTRTAAALGALAAPTALLTRHACEVRGRKFGRSSSLVLNEGAATRFFPVLALTLERFCVDTTDGLGGFTLCW
jgi:hypothetical protein